MSLLALFFLSSSMICTTARFVCESSWARLSVAFRRCSTESYWFALQNQSMRAVPRALLWKASTSLSL